MPLVLRRRHCHRTFRDKSQDAEILQLLSDIVTNLEEDMKRTGFAGRTVVVKYKASRIFLITLGMPVFDRANVCCANAAAYI